VWTLFVAGVRLPKCLPIRASIAQGEEIMKSSGLRSRLAALVTAGIACVCLLSLSSATAWAKVGSIKEFPIPTSGSSPFGITAGPDGNLWFTENTGNKIGRITTSGVITEFAVPTSGSSPFGITKGPDGNLWFTEFFGVGKIGRITTAGVVINEFPIPTGLSRPEGITAGPARTASVWFTEVMGNKIGKITT